jgi:hypothetical protein
MYKDDVDFIDAYAVYENPLNRDETPLNYAFQDVQ